MARSLKIFLTILLNAVTDTLLAFQLNKNWGELGFAIGALIGYFCYYFRTLFLKFLPGLIRAFQLIFLWMDAKFLFSSSIAIGVMIGYHFGKAIIGLEYGIGLGFLVYSIMPNEMEEINKIKS